MSMDAFLVQQTLDGDDKSFGQLVQKYQSSVYKICLAIVKNPQDAEELTQDVFVCAYQKLAQLKELDKFPQWIKKIAQNLSKSRRRRLKAVHEVTLTQIQDEPAPKPSLEDFDKLNPADLMLRQELIDAVMAAIESLPQKDRQVIKAYIDGFDHKTISIQTGLSYRASINRLYRIRKEITQKVKHLLNGIGILFNSLPLKKCVEGGIVAMKIKASVKIGTIAIGAMAIILAGSIGIKSLLKLNEKGIADSHQSAARVQPQMTKETSPPVAAKKPASVSTQISAETNDDSRKQIPRVEKPEAMDMPEPEKPLKLETADEESHDEESQGESTKSEAEPKETILQRYQRIKSTPEFKAEWNAACGVIFDELNRVIQERDALREKEEILKEMLTNISEGENRKGIQEELEATQAELKALNAKVREVGARVEKASWEVHLRYFTREERLEALKQMAEAGKIPILHNKK